MLPDIPLSQEAQRLAEVLMPKIQQRLRDVERVPVSVLVWGPAPASTNPIAAVRVDLRAALREQGHLALFSEELCDPESPYSVRTQQLAQASEFDLVVSIPSSPGSIAEAHDFAVDPRVSSKLLLFVDQSRMDGYSPHSLAVMSTIVSCEIVKYPSETQTDVIVVKTLEVASQIREMKFITGRSLV